MGNSLRCCLSCILPCGALDLIRVVHLDGSVDELTAGRVITAAHVLAAHPNHLLTTPCSRRRRRVLILSPDSHLKRGSIYFLVPAASLPAEKTGKILQKFGTKKAPETNVVVPEQTSSEKTKPDALRSCRRRRRSRSGSAGGLTWRPDLESILEN